MVRKPAATGWRTSSCAAAAATLPELHADDVFGIHREVVAQREAAARIEGKIVADPLVAFPAAAARTVAAPGEIFHRGLDVGVRRRPGG